MHKWLWVILGLALILRLIGLEQSFWLDEAAQVIESARPLNQQLQIIADFQPPGLHLLLHFWMLLGRSEAWVRLLSVGFGLGSIWLTYLLGKTLQNEKLGLLAALFLALSPYHIWYSQEARPYMMLVFFACLTTYFFITKRWRWYTLGLIGAWYSTYFSPFVFLGHLICVLWLQRSSLRQFFLSHLLAGMVFALWLPSFFQQLAVGTNGFFSGWTDVVSFLPVKGALLTFAKFILGKGSIDNNLLYAAAILPVGVLFLFSCRHSWKTHAGKILLVSFWVPFLASVVVTLFVPILAPQRLTFALPIFVLLLAQGAVALPSLRQKGAIALVICSSLFGIGQYYLDPSVQREQWRQAVRFVEQTPRQEAISLFAFPEPFAPYAWYRQTNQEAVGIAPAFRIQDTDLQRLQNRLAGKSTVYLFQYLTGLTDPTGKTPQYLQAHGFRQTDQKNFEGVGFIYVFQRS